MNETQHALWTRLNAYQLDAVDATLPFSKRLARENNWTLPYAQRVITEYKRFVFLALTSNHPVTPSDEIDQVWHLHLIYTEAYWEDFCKNVIRMPFHHHPTKGGAAEGDKFRKWYAKTKQTYAETFGEEPPSDIWKNEQERFTLAPHYKRINTASHWIIPKPIALMPMSVAAVVMMTMALLVVSCVDESAPTDNKRLGAIIGIILFIIVLSSFVFAFQQSSQKEKSKDDTSGTGCSGVSDVGGDSESGGDGDGGSGCSGCGN